ncbi:hypothetical protein XENORESO_021691 [Xenotaenia resolanae]|uniref:C2H2-type domain-containing protein n=1 Tax=Xenotaenia resolanae TaxID=208358 RepID=A0ABV0X6Q0_9TELE
MKIHDKDPASGLIPLSSPPSPTKRRRPSVKRRHGVEDEPGDEPPSKKATEDAGADESVVVQGSAEELLPCPICFKTCSSRLDLDAHMDTHPDTVLRYGALLPCVPRRLPHPGVSSSTIPGTLN